LVDCVVDLDRDGELKGIEVLLLRQQVPELAAGLTQPGHTGSRFESKRASPATR